jgi:hypothetical protein
MFAMQRLAVFGGLGFVVGVVSSRLWLSRKSSTQIDQKSQTRAVSAGDIRSSFFPLLPRIPTNRNTPIKNNRVQGRVESIIVP